MRRGFRRIFDGCNCKYMRCCEISSLHMYTYVPIECDALLLLRSDTVTLGLVPRGCFSVSSSVSLSNAVGFVLALVFRFGCGFFFEGFGFVRDGPARALHSIRDYLWNINDICSPASGCSSSTVLVATLDLRPAFFLTGLPECAVGLDFLFTGDRACSVSCIESTSFD